MGTAASCNVFDRTTTAIGTAIIGAGPVGLSCARTLSINGYDNFRLIEAGKAFRDRDRYDPRDALQGIYACTGLSDGKYSSWPAGSELYARYGDKLQLKAAYDELCEIFAHHGIELAPLDIAAMTFHLAEQSAWQLKRYPCVDTTLEQRMILADDYVQAIGPDRIMLHTRVKHIAQNATGSPYKYTLTIEQQTSEGTHISYIACNNIVIGTGRFGCHEIADDFIPRRFRRVEFGVRIAGNSFDPFFARPAGCIDPKYIKRLYDDSGKQIGQIRTFCFCHRGEVVQTESSCGVRTYSGRADCAPTMQTNFGFLLRSYLPEMQTVLDAIMQSGETFEINARELLENPDRLSHINAEYSHAMHNALCDLMKLDQYQNVAEMTLYGPTIEGVGDYYDIDETTLRIPDQNIWVGGDASGYFRGSVPSHLSGGAVAAQIIALTNAEPLSYA
jgi:hypothetical protein